MSNFLKKSSTWLQDVHNNHCSEDITYTPLGGSPVSLKAVMGLPRPEQLDSEGGTMARMLDIIIDWPAFTPKPGDLVEHGTRQFSVVLDPIDGGAFRASDAYANRMRIHLQETHS